METENLSKPNPAAAGNDDSGAGKAIAPIKTAPTRPDKRVKKEITVRDNGVLNYPKADIRRIFVLLAAIDVLKRPTRNELVAYTGHNKGTIDADVSKVCEQLGVKISRDGPRYCLDDWGPILNRAGVIKCLKG